MNSNEIKKALERYVFCYGKDIFIADNIKVADILDLINQYEAENKRLNKEVDRLSQVVLYNDGVTEMKVEEAIKEFAERLEPLKKFRSCVTESEYELSVTMREIDNLLKEMGVE